MNRRSFLSWGTAGVASLFSGVAVSLGAVVRYLVPNVFYEPPQSFRSFRRRIRSSRRALAT